VFIPELIVLIRGHYKCESLSILKYSVDAEYRNLMLLTRLAGLGDAWRCFDAPSDASANDGCWLGYGRPHGAAHGQNGVARWGDGNDYGVPA
jgi:hypothetical protein